MDELDRKLLNRLQQGLPVTRNPFQQIAEEVDIPVVDVLARIEKLKQDKVLSRFGPMFNAEKMGGALSLCAMEIAESDFDLVAEQVNSFPEVAHNYARDHKLNMWFVLATEQQEELQDVITDIEKTTGYKVYNMPKLDEFYVGLQLAV